MDYKAVVYEDKYLRPLYNMCVELAMELTHREPSGIEIDVEDIVDYMDIVILLYKDKPIGFIGGSYNGNFGILEPVYGINYVYIYKRFRKGIGSLYLMSVIGNIVKDKDCDIEFYYSTNGQSKYLMDNIPHKKLYDCCSMRAEDIVEYANKIKHTLNRRLK